MMEVTVNGQGICTAHQHWDWGDDDDEGGLKDPPDPIPVNQLSLFPLTPNEEDYDDSKVYSNISQK